MHSIWKTEKSKVAHNFFLKRTKSCPSCVVVTDSNKASKGLLCGWSFAWEGWWGFAWEDWNLDPAEDCHIFVKMFPEGRPTGCCLHCTFTQFCWIESANLDSFLTRFSRVYFCFSLFQEKGENLEKFFLLRKEIRISSKIFSLLIGEDSEWTNQPGGNPCWGISTPFLDVIH